MNRLTFITCLKTTLFTKKPKNMYRSYEYNNFDIIVISSFPWKVCMFCTVMDCAYLDLWLWCMFEFYMYVTSRISHQICSYQHHKILHNPSSETKGTKKSLSDTYCSVLLLLPRCTHQPWQTQKINSCEHWKTSLKLRNELSMFVYINLSSYLVILSEFFSYLGQSLLGQRGFLKLWNVFSVFVYISR